jgi:hypothetical protein
MFGFGIYGLVFFGNKTSAIYLAFMICFRRQGFQETQFCPKFLRIEQHQTHPKKVLKA